MLSIVIWSLHNVYIYQNSTLYTLTVTSRKANQFSPTAPFETYLTYYGFFLFFLLKIHPPQPCTGPSFFAELRTGYMVTVLVSPWDQGFHLVSSHIYPEYNTMYGPHNRLKYSSASKHSFLIPAPNQRHAMQRYSELLICVFSQWFQGGLSQEKVLGLSNPCN